MNIYDYLESVFGVLTKVAAAYMSQASNVAAQYIRTIFSER